MRAIWRERHFKGVILHFRNEQICPNIRHECLLTHLRTANNDIRHPFQEETLKRMAGKIQENVNRLYAARGYDQYDRRSACNRIREIIHFIDHLDEE